MQNSIYLVLSKPVTNVSWLIGLFTGKPYTHVSVAGNTDLSDMYSFCRKYKHLPLPGVFSLERIGRGDFGKHIPCEIYRIDLDDEQRKTYDEIIDHFVRNRNKYEYNVLGLITIPLKKNIRRKNKYVCSQFAAYVLQSMNIPLERQEVFLNSPEDLRHLQAATLVYSGDLNEYIRRKSVPFAGTTSVA